MQRWADAGRVHVTDTAEQAHAAILTAWNVERARWSDPHERVAQLLMLAHTNRDVDALNAGARALRQAAGELTGPERTYRLRDGRHVTLSGGDAVLLRVNDRRTHRGGADVLNGYRGIVTALDTTGPDAGRVQVEWRRPGPDGPELVREWVTADYVTRGGVTLGYAITASKAQGLTADRALIYGGGMDAHVLYPAMSRDRWRADLYLARALVEDPADVVRHGPPATAAEARERTIAAYAAAMERDRPDGLVLTELGEQIEPIRPAGGRGEAVDVDQAAAPADGTVAYWDAVTATVGELPDTALHADPTRLEQAARRRRANTDPAGYRHAEQARRREVLAELHRLAAGADPSGRFTRAELADVARRMRAAAARRDREAELRAAVARVQQLPAGARTGYVDWEHRDHGTVPTAQLPAAIAAADREAARLADLAHRQAEAATAAVAAADAGHGPAVQALAAQREQLAARIAAGNQAAQLRQAETVARAAERHGWAEVHRLDAELRRNRIVLRLSGTSRAEITEAEQTRRSGQQWHQHATRLRAEAHLRDRMNPVLAGPKTSPAPSNRPASRWPTPTRPSTRPMSVPARPRPAAPPTTTTTGPAPPSTTAPLSAGRNVSVDVTPDSRSSSVSRPDVAAAASPAGRVGSPASPAVAVQLSSQQHLPAARRRAPCRRSAGRRTAPPLIDPDTFAAPGSGSSRRRCRRGR